MYTASGILFNHESPRRGYEFVTRKITSTVARILKGKATELRLGNLEPLRDWGDARQYVEAMWLMLQQEKADDFVVATGRLHSVQQFVEIAFSSVGLDWRKFVVVDQDYYRPAEKIPLCGNPSKAKRVLGWEATTDFALLVREMVAEDCRLLGLVSPK